MKLPPRRRRAVGIRYFTAIDGLMDGNADVIQETRQGDRHISGARRLFPAVPTADRFVANLTVRARTTG